MRVRWPLLAVLSLTGGCLLALQLVYVHDAVPAPSGGQRVAPEPALDALAGAGSPVEAGTSAGAATEARGEAVPGPEPSAGPAEKAPDQGRELAVSECVERRAQAAGVDRIRPMLPGRWPALKRAREVQRLRRVELRASCEKELVREN